ncbi:hypothetical protein [Bacillus thuringiensis]|uniref:hypothetical protein n=1 Tax=Bacillus thuringiensis TaxID=1428 RepID=UPI0021D665FE|nr:hypothetical protein [Bacillus thuringiensis]MCU7667519.1 hypothetical protein [Bacillus thuringiensis]
MQEKINQIKSILPTYIQSWHNIPSDIDASNVKIIEIRKVEGFKTERDLAWIIGFETDENIYRELLMDEELEYSIDDFKEMIEKENETHGMLARDVVCFQFFDEYPLIYRTK